MNRLWTFGCFVLCLFWISQASPAEMPLRIGVLKFGSVSWELEVMQRHGFDRAEGFRIERLELATNQATQVALQARQVDAIVSDWLWVSRQRGEGTDWTFFPFSTALGAVIVPQGSDIHSASDLAGRRLGIAGSPLDKSWLLLRALSRQKFGRDLNETAIKTFAAPPLLGEQLQAGRLDAVLTYWPFAAKLEARGMQRLIGMDGAMEELGIKRLVPLVGYVVSEQWAKEHRELVQAFLRASGRARQVLAESDSEWDTIAPMTGAADGKELARIRDAYRAGIPRRWGAEERRDAARLFRLLAEIGGKELVGRSAELQPGTFLEDVSY
jgi:NitT/TauT family transport system substrate-binding protein